MRETKTLGWEIAFFAAVVCFVCVAAAWGKKASRPITTPDGKPVRKVFVSAATPDMTSRVTRMVTQNTCLTVVPSKAGADAVLNAGIALPGAAGQQQSLYGVAPETQTVSNPDKKAQLKVSASAGCEDTTPCQVMPSTPPGELGQPVDLGGSGDTKLDVSLQSKGTAAQGLWAPNSNSKKSWSEQLRVAAGCPVCPGKQFDRRKYKTYRSWIQAECPAVLASR